MRSRRVRLIALMLLVPLVSTVTACRQDPVAAARAFVTSADAYAARGELEAAVIEYRNAVDLQPGDADVHYKLALVYEQLQEPEKAYAAFAEAARLDDANIDAGLRVAGLLAGIGEHRRAVEIAERVLAREPRNAQALAILARALDAGGQTAAAGRRLDEALAIDPRSPHALVVRAEWELRGKQPARARRTLQQAIDAAPRFADAHLMLGRVEWTSGNHPGAEGALRRALEASTYPFAVHRILAAFYVDIGEAPRAEPHLRAAAAAGGPDRLALADYFIRTGRVDDAARELDPLLTDRSLAGEAMLRRAMVAYATGDAARAHVELDTAAAHPAVEARARLLKGELHLEGGDADAAHAQVRRALELEPRSPEASYLAALASMGQGDMSEAERFLKRAGTLASDRTAVDVQLARLALQRGDRATALRLARHVATASPVPATHALLSRVLRESGRMGDARRIITSARQRWPRAGLIEIEAGHVELQDGRVSAARAAYERALELDPTLRQPRYGLVLTHLATGGRDQARASIDRWHAEAPHDAQAVLLAAALDVSEGKDAAAEQTLLRALQSRPQDITLLEALGRLYAATGRPSEALRQYEQVAARRPRPVEALTMIGMLKEQSGDRAGARDAYARALEFDRTAGIAANNLAMILAGSGPIDEALRLARSAAAALQNAPEALDTLGWIYHLKGDAQNALRALGQARQKAPANPVYAYHFGVAALAAGRPGEARAALTAALRAPAPFDGADEARRLLASLP